MDPRVTDDSRPLRPPLADMRPPRRHGWVTWAIVVAVVALPILETVVLVRTGQAIGFLPTVLLLVATSLLGGWLMRREGSRAWRALREASTSGRLPTGELADAGLVLVGGTLLLLPGFITDVVGLLFLLPLTRPLARRVLGYAVARRNPGMLDVSRPPRPDSPDVVEAEVVDVADEPVSGDIQDPEGRVIRRLEP